MKGIAGNASEVVHERSPQKDIALPEARLL